MKDIERMLDRSWNDCLKQRSTLEIPLLNTLIPPENKQVTATGK